MFEFVEKPKYTKVANFIIHQKSRIRGITLLNYEIF